MEVIPQDPFDAEVQERRNRKRACRRKRNRELSKAHKDGAACPPAVAVNECKIPSVPTSGEKDVRS